MGLPDAFDDHMTITYNLMHLAYQGDISRVFSFMTGHEASDRAYPHIGIPEQHHTISHHGNDPEKLAKYAKIATYQIVKFADFLEEAEGDQRRRRDTAGSLGGSIRGSGMSNGNAHDRNNPPAVMVGGEQWPPQRQPAHRREGYANREPAAGAGARGWRGGIESLPASTGRVDL